MESTYTILLVANIMHVRAAIEKMLGDMGHTVTSAETPLDALRLLGDENASSFDLVVSCVEMPSINGLAFGRMVKDRFPNMKLVFVSDLEPQALIERYGFADIISKRNLLKVPFREENLCWMVRKNMCT